MISVLRQGRDMVAHVVVIIEENIVEPTSPEGSLALPKSTASVLSELKEGTCLVCFLTDQDFHNLVRECKYSSIK